MLNTLTSFQSNKGHKFGLDISGCTTLEEGMQKANLDWSVRTERLVRPDGTPVEAKAVVRETDGKTLGVVGMRYKPLQNLEAFEFFRPFIESGEASLETAGSFFGGERIWVMAKLNKAPIEVSSNDIINKYILLSNGHDGALAVRVGFIPFRLLCSNSLAMAWKNENSKSIRLVHSSNVQDNLEMLRDTMNAIDTKFEATAEQMRLLKRRAINRKDLEKYVEVSLGLEEIVDDGRAATMRAQLMQKITELFEISPGAREAGHTYWGAYNAVNYYLNHEKGRSIDGRLNNLWFGQARNTDLHAFESAVKMAV